jgi:hypothetical protein
MNSQILDDIYAKYRFVVSRRYSLLFPDTSGKGIMSKEDFIKTIKEDQEFSKSWDLIIEERDMTWEEQVEWVMRNTDVDLENVYIVEEIAKPSTPKKAIELTHNNKKHVYYV